ncbi:hypothetical protein AeMF1_010843 [Aphanomyces euteiches]|nr:hypothetical protein AeMF1_010843 [Aphanomyces euteiches]KAH9189668.1 hypothetical protein AeNC1_008353 [Aphanomyces euteiches]
MKIFVTGATGFVGSVVVSELIRAGHEVTGLARSDKAAEALAAVGAKSHRGNLDDLDSLRAGASTADAVIHLGFNHDFSKYLESCEADGRVVRTLGDALKGSNRLLVVTSVFTASNSPDRPNDETVTCPVGPPRAITEAVADEVAATGVRVVAVRLPPSVHGRGDGAFVPGLIAIAREKGVSAYVGDGSNRWSAVHRLDAAVLYRLVVEKATESGRVHAIAEESVAFRDIAEAIGSRLKVPVVSKTANEAKDHFGFLAQFVSMDRPVSSQWTRETFGWKPLQPSLIDDINSEAYFP